MSPYDNLLASTSLGQAGEDQSTQLYRFIPICDDVIPHIVGRRLIERSIVDGETFGGNMS